MIRRNGHYRTNRRGADMSQQDETELKKREDYIRWDEYFMATAILSAKRSKDPYYKVGACIVDKDKKIIGTGYNGMPNRCSDKEIALQIDSIRVFVCHAEMNAILNRYTADLKDCTIYVTLFPCNECAKMIIQSGISKVYYLSDEKGDREIYVASKRMFEAAGVEYVRYIPNLSKIEIYFKVDLDAMSSSSK